MRKILELLKALALKIQGGHRNLRATLGPSTLATTTRGGMYRVKNADGAARGRDTANVNTQERATRISRRSKLRQTAPRLFTWIHKKNTREGLGRRTTPKRIKISECRGRPGGPAVLRLLVLEMMNTRVPCPPNFFFLFLRGRRRLDEQHVRNGMSSFTALSHESTGHATILICSCLLKCASY